MLRSPNDYVAIMEVKKKVKVWSEIGGTAGYRGDVNVMNVDGDIVDGGCNGEVLSDGVIREDGVEGKVDESDGIMNEDNHLISPLHHTCYQNGPYGQWCSLEGVGL